MVSAHKTDWDNKLASTVYAYNTAEKTTTGHTPYFLVYGQHPLSILSLGLPSLLTEDPEVAVMEDRLAIIEELEEEREAALDQTKAVQDKRKFRFDSRIRHEPIFAGDLVLIYDSRHQKFPGKLHVRWIGPYLVNRVYENGSLECSTLDHEPLPTRVNGSRVKKYHEVGHLLEDE